MGSQIYMIERRSMMVPGKKPVTITHEVNLNNGVGRNTVRVQRGKRIVKKVVRKIGKTRKNRS
jgi:hypothetical protein